MRDNDEVYFMSCIRDTVLGMQNNKYFILIFNILNLEDYYLISYKSA